jgi:hypothetical protein
MRVQSFSVADVSRATRRQLGRIGGRCESPLSVASVSISYCHSQGASTINPQHAVRILARHVSVTFCTRQETYEGPSVCKSGYASVRTHFQHFIGELHCTDSSKLTLQS